MSDRKGLTLIEIIVVLVIIGVLTALAIPNYLTMMTQGAANDAKNNLITIYNAQKNYYLNPTSGSTYYNSGSANDQAGINTALNLNISDTSFKYTCTTAAGPSYTCTATNLSDTNLILTVKSGAPNNPNPLVSLGGTGCATNAGASCNPACATDIAAYCPTN